MGEIPGASAIPLDLAEAMAILIGRSVGCHVDPTECKGPAALVALAVDMGWVALSGQSRASFHTAATSLEFLDTQRTPIALEVVEGLPDAQ